MIATAREANATYSVYVGSGTAALHADIASGNPSGAITLKAGSVTRVILEVQGTRTVRYTLYLNYAERPAIDTDHDGLVDLNYLEDVHAISFNFAGGEIGYRSSETAVLSQAGCPGGVCRGYELQRSLDFNDPASYRDADANQAQWSNAGWQPIAMEGALFDGNGNTISNLKVRSSGGGGLFSTLASSSIESLGLLNVDLSGASVSGGIARTLSAGGTISNSYVIGSIETERSAGGLVAESTAGSEISNSYFIGTIVTTDRAAGNAIGGLIAYQDGTLNIKNSRVIGRLIANNDVAEIGLIAQNAGDLDIEHSLVAALGMRATVPDMALLGNPDRGVLTIEQSYFDSEIAQVDEPANHARSTAELQSPTASGSTVTSVYYGWSADDWDFGTTAQYPAIKYNAAECESDVPSSRCAVLPYQGSLLKSFALIGNAGINRRFDFATFNYAIAVGSDQERLQFTASAFNRQAQIVISKDGIEVGEYASGAPIPPLALNRQGDSVVEIVVKESAERSSYRYRFIVSRLDVIVNFAAIDADADGLIEVGTAEQLDAMHYSLAGNVYKESFRGIEVYCRVGCVGFELIADIDLAGVNWQPIGTASNPFNAHFNGNGYTISNLNINQSGIFLIPVGLFNYVGAAATIENIRLLNFNINGNTRVAALAASNFGTINNSHTINSDISGSDDSTIGGLVASNFGTIYNSSVVNGNISGGLHVGGLIGLDRGTIINSRAIDTDVTVTENIIGNAGGLVGNYFRTIEGSFAIGGNVSNLSNINFQE